MKMEKEQVVIDGRVIIDIFPEGMWDPEDSAALLLKILARRESCREYYDEKARQAES